MRYESYIAFAVYAYFSGGTKAVKSFFGNILSPAVTSLATQSSIATLPVNMEAAEEIGVPKDVSGIILPIGATMHMDGSVLAAVLKISFLYGIFGMEFAGWQTYLISIVIAILSGVVLPLFSILCFQLAFRLYHKRLPHPIKCAGVIFAAGAVCAFLLWTVGTGSPLLLKPGCCCGSLCHSSRCCGRRTM